MRSLSGVRLFIATPAYGGMVTTAYLESLLDARAALEADGATIAVYTVRNESLVTRARNACVARFLAARAGGEPFTHLMFIDADIGFPGEAIGRLLAFGEPVVAGCYPMKSIDYAAIAELARAGHPLAERPDTLEAATAAYPLNAPPITELRDGFIPVDDVGAGFLLLQRRVLEEMIAAGGETLRYTNNVAGYEVPARDHELAAPVLYHALFEAGIDPESRLYLSEDFAFLRRWRRLRPGENRVWMDVTLPLRHLGSHEWRGHVGYFLERHGVLARAG
jgi:hypothetical protein